VRIWDTATPSFNFDAEPEIDINPLMTIHEIEATVTIERTDGDIEPAPGEMVYLDVLLGPNLGDIDSAYTQNDGIATLSYLGDGGVGTDTINVWKDQNCDGRFETDIDYEDEVEKVWAQPVFVDIKPNSCPNPLNIKSKGVLPAAILGTEDFDVGQIDPESVELGFGPGTDPFDGGVPADKAKTSYEDVETPYDKNCDYCPPEVLGPDGFMDLTLKFPTQDIVSYLKDLGLDADGSCITLHVRGNLRPEFGGTAIVGDDVVRIINKGSSNAATTVESTESFIHCTDQPKYGQCKVAQVPIPWQFWGIEIDTATGATTVIDRIRISPTWLEPPNDQPGGDGGVWVRRWWTTVPEPLPLEELVWNPGELPSANWESDDVPMMVEDGDPNTPPEDLELRIPIIENGPVGAVIVAYEVIPEDQNQPGMPAEEASAHFINEAILVSESPYNIVQIMVNFDIHNNTNYDVTNFELDFLGMSFDCDDVEKALGFVVGEPGKPWGANADNPLVVRPITVIFPDGTTQTGTEVKWIQPDRPLQFCEWLHIGLVLDCTGFDCFNDPTDPNLRATVQGYWTVNSKVWCEEAVNPHGKTVPPAGWSTLPGPKGGQNDEGFYRLFAEDPCPDPTVPLPLDNIYVGYLDEDGDFVQVAPTSDPLQPGYNYGDIVKITEAKGKTAGTVKKIGTSSPKGKAKAVIHHIILPSDPVLMATDAAGNVIYCDDCLVPPPPK
jgi:hypothetical protein